MQYFRRATGIFFASLFDIQLLVNLIINYIFAKTSSSMKLFPRLLSALLACIVCGCSKSSEGSESIPTLTLSSTQESFVNSTAYLDLSLTSATKTDVVISLSATADFDKSLISFRNPVTIQAGSTVGHVLVTVNDQNLTPGQYHVTISVVGAAGANLPEGGASATLKLIVRKAIVEVSLSGPENFTDGKATLSLTPDAPPVQNITVTLEVLKFGASEGKQLIPPGAISCPESVVLPADQAEPTTFLVRVDMEQVGPVESEAIIAIESVSAGATVGEADEVHIGAKGELKAKVRADWSISYGGDKANPYLGGIVQSLIEVQGFQSEDGGGFYTFGYDEGFINSEFGSVTNYLQKMEEDIEYWIKNENPYPIKTLNVAYTYTRFPVGGYEFYMLGCDSQGLLTGDYAVCSFNINPTAKMQEAYPKWIGTWEVNGAKWVVSEKKSNSSYIIKNIGVQGSEFVAYIGWDCELEIRGTEYYYFNATDWCRLYGLYYNGDGTTKLYYADYSGPVAKAALNPSEKSAQWTGCINPSTTLPFDVIGVWDSASQKWMKTALPEFMARDHEGEADSGGLIGEARYAHYEDFLGEWTYGGRPYILKQKEYNHSYVIEEEYDTDMTFKTEYIYHPDSGSVSLHDQVIGEYPGYGKFILTGAWYSNNKLKYLPYFPYIVDNPGSYISCLYMQNDGTVYWPGLAQSTGGDSYIIHAMMYVFAQYGQGGQYLGYIDLGDVIDFDELDNMRRPGNEAGTDRAPAKAKAKASSDPGAPKRTHSSLLF